MEQSNIRLLKTLKASHPTKISDTDYIPDNYRFGSFSGFEYLDDDTSSTSRIESQKANREAVLNHKLYYVTHSRKENEALKTTQSIYSESYIGAAFIMFRMRRKTGLVSVGDTFSVKRKDDMKYVVFYTVTSIIDDSQTALRHNGGSYLKSDT